jgi:hypothetical protein
MLFSLYRCPYNAFVSFIPTDNSQYSVKAIDWTTEVSFSASAGALLFVIASRPALEPTKPPKQCVPWVIFPGIKQTVGDADYSPASNTEIKKKPELALHN